MLTREFPVAWLVGGLPGGEPRCSSGILPWSTCAALASSCAGLSSSMSSSLLCVVGLYRVGWSGVCCECRGLDFGAGKAGLYVLVQLGVHVVAVGIAFLRCATCGSVLECLPSVHSCGAMDWAAVLMSFILFFAFKFTFSLSTTCSLFFIFRLPVFLGKGHECFPIMFHVLYFCFAALVHVPSLFSDGIKVLLRGLPSFEHPSSRLLLGVFFVPPNVLLRLSYFSTARDHPRGRQSTN